MDTMKMKVLWFTHNDCGYSRKFFSDKVVPHTGTWTESIAKLMLGNPNIELGIAFHSKWHHEIRKEKNITYYPINSSISRNKFQRFMHKLMNRKVDYENKMNEYLSIVESFEPNLIHVFGTEENFGFISKYVRVPLVLSIQGNLTVYQWKYFSGMTRKELFFYLDFQELVRFNTSYYKYVAFKHKSKREKELLKSIKYIIGRTEWDRRISRVLSQHSIYFHNDEVLREVFYNYTPNYSSLGTVLNILTISGPAPYKGLETVCMAVNILNELGVNFHWSIIGLNSTDNLVNSVRKKLRNNFPMCNITFLGKMDAEAIISELQCSDLYVLPSHIENSPLTLSEAMICGIPTIAANSGGIPSRISTNEGALVQSGDPWALSGAILEVLDNYDSAILKAKLARKRAIIRHDRNKIIKELTEIYSTLINLN